MNLYTLANAENTIIFKALHTLVQRHKVIPYVVCALSMGFSPICHAQTLKPTEQKKVAALKARLNKAISAQNQANTILSQYRIFRVMGEVQAGDTTYARIWGKAVPYSDSRGAGALYENTIVYVKNPTDDNYQGGNFDGFCTFLGVINGANTYFPIAKQTGYVNAKASSDKWQALVSSIQGEINAVYRPYKQKEKAKAAEGAAKRQRVAQAQEQLARAQQELEQAKQARAQQQQEETDVAQIQAELAKVEAENARLREEKAKAESKRLQEIEQKKQVELDTLKNTVSLIAGEQLGKIRLGMTEVQVLQLMGTPASSQQINKPEKEESYDRIKYFVSFAPSTIRRDRYFLKSSNAFEVFYEGKNEALEYFSSERGIGKIQSGDLKKDFVFDVFYLRGKVVQIESDSPQFFTADQKNLQSNWKFEKPYQSGFISDYRDIPNRARQWGTTSYGSYYVGDRETGFSLRLEAISPSESEILPSPYPRSRLKVVIHAPNTVPYTGDYQLGISLVNRTGKSANTYNSDADNKEERMFASPKNPEAN